MMASGLAARAGGAIGLQCCQRLANLPGARSQAWLLLPQLGEQRFEAEAWVRNPQSTHGLK